MAEDKSPNWAKWKHIPTVRLWQAIALSFNIDPDVAGNARSRARADSALNGKEAKEFRDRLDVLRANFHRHPQLKATSINMGDADESSLLLAPFAAWALSIEWQIPSELVAIGSDERDRLAESIAAIAQERDALKARVAELEQLANGCNEKPLGTRERETLLKLVIGLAMKGFDYDPSASRNDAVGQIKAALEGVGFGVSDDTIRDKLKEAASLLPR